LLLSPLLAAQNAGGTAPVVPHQRNNRYTITSTNVPARDAGLVAAVSKTLAQELTQKGFEQVKPLDTQCCNIQLQVVDSSSPASSSQNHKFVLDVHINVLDVDFQLIYGKIYHGEAPPGAGQDAAAAAEVAKAAIADDAFLKALAHP
jgi:hypothetical protein